MDGPVIDADCCDASLCAMTINARRTLNQSGLSRADGYLTNRWSICVASLSDIRPVEGLLICHLTHPLPVDGSQSRCGRVRKI